MASTGTFVNPDSVLARTAREMMEAHAGGAGPREGMTICPVCSRPLPCPSGRAAAEVLLAAGLAQSSGLISASRQGSASSPLGLPMPEQAPVGLPMPEQAPVAGSQAAESFGYAGSPALPEVSFDQPPSVAAFGNEPSSLSGWQPPSPNHDPVDTPIEEEPSGLSFSVPESAAPDDDARMRFEASSARVPSAAAAETVEVPRDDVDPLLLGPPLYTQQNRPLDAPQFRPSAGPPAYPGQPSVYGQAAGQPVVHEPAAGQPGVYGEPAPEQVVYEQPAGQPGVYGEPAPQRVVYEQPAGQPAVYREPTSGQVGLAPYTGQPVQPGQTPPPGQPGQAPTGPTHRGPLQAPEMGQVNRPLEGAGSPVQATQQAAQNPVIGHQATTAPLGRSARPPLEAPQMGQLNRPLPQPSAQAAATQAAPQDTPSGLPPAAALQTPPKAKAIHGVPGNGLPPKTSGAPSGLSGHTAATQHAAHGEAPVERAADDRNTPSGLPRRDAG